MPRAFCFPNIDGGAIRAPSQGVQAALLRQNTTENVPLIGHFIIVSLLKSANIEVYSI